MGDLYQIAVDSVDRSVGAADDGAGGGGGDGDGAGEGQVFVDHDDVVRLRDCER